MVVGDSVQSAIGSATNLVFTFCFFRIRATQQSQSKSSAPSSSVPSPDVLSQRRNSTEEKAAAESERMQASVSTAVSMSTGRWR